MEVEVGSFSDPEGLEGLAHFLGEFTDSTPLLTSSVLLIPSLISLCSLPTLRFRLRFVACSC